WFRARMGIPTASEFVTVMRTKGRGEGGESKERRTYMCKLAGERITGDPMESYSNAFMERGKAMEEEARSFYALMTNAKLQRVGFVHEEALRAGASPDSLIGEDGGLEIKTCAPHLLIGHIELDRPPPEHIPQ